MNTTLYNRIFIGSFLLLLALLTLLSLRTEPIDGDLTRTGGFLETEFGWNASDVAFEAPYLFRMAESLSDYDRAFDVVILGDSFTRRSHISWASHLANMTGLSIVAFHHRNLKVSELLQSDAFQANPPKLFVYQSVERNAVRRLASLTGLDPVELGTLPKVQITPSGTEPRPLVAYERSTEFKDFEERISVSIHYLKLWGKQLLPGTERRVRMKLRSDAPTLFSNRSSDEILLSNLDFELRSPEDSQIARAIDGMRALNRSLEDSGVRPVFVLFPDKLTVYADWLEETRWRSSSVLPRLARAVSMPRLDQALQLAVKDGLVDVYHPNNTHTSGRGAQVAAETVIHFLDAGNDSLAVATSAQTRTANSGLSSHRLAE